MLEIKRTAIGLDEKDLLELEGIITDGDERGAGQIKWKKEDLVYGRST